jgi:hypothetical protein
MADVRLQELRADAGQDSTWSNPSKISRKVRELAHRSHRAMKARNQAEALARPGSDDIQEDLRDLRDQVARLQHKIHVLRLGVLIPWVDALRKQVEDRLGNETEAVAR